MNVTIRILDIFFYRDSISQNRLNNSFDFFQLSFELKQTKIIRFKKIWHLQVAKQIFVRCKQFCFFFMAHTSIFWAIELTKVACLEPQFLFQNGILKNVKKIEKIRMNSEKSINSFEMKKG